VLRRFVLTLLASWLATPLGVMLAHAAGVANDPTVLVLLFAQAYAAPFQLLLNEGLASCVSRHRRAMSSATLTMCLALLAVTCAAGLWLIGAQQFTGAHVFLATLAVTLSCAWSFHSARMYYALVIYGRSAARQAAIVGLIPGMTTLGIFAAYAAVRETLPAVPQEWLLLVAATPSMLQWLYIRHCSVDAPDEHRQRAQTHSLRLTAALSALVAISFGSITVRDQIASTSLAHIALILTGLNALASVVMTVTRVIYLQGSGASSWIVLVATAAVLTAISTWAWAFQANLFLALFGWLLALQCAAIAVIEGSRRHLVRDLDVQDRLPGMQA
jgi:hypothetical protein